MKHDLESIIKMFRTSESDMNTFVVYSHASRRLKQSIR